MTGHRAIVAAGPSTIRRLCCGTGEVADGEAAAAVDGIDDPVVLVDEQPVAVAALWGALLRSLACPGRQPESVLVIHPSWWSRARVGLVTGAARTLADDVLTRSRSQLLSAAAGCAVNARTPVVVEIAARLVAVTVAVTVAEPRIGPAHQVADAVVRRVTALTRGAAAAVLIDGPPGIEGAAALAGAIADRLPSALAGCQVELVGDTRLARLARLAAPASPVAKKPVTVGSRWPSRVPALLAATVALAALGVAAVRTGTRDQPGAGATEAVPTTFLVEGRVTLQVPAQWTVQRVTAGPGSARVEVISPSDPQLMLHVTQSILPWADLTSAAESLRHAIDEANAAESAGVFVDFDPSGNTAGRPAVTYREVRAGHHIDWTVLVDGGVRISVGCQSRPDGAAEVREVCERAVRSAHTLS